MCAPTWLAPCYLPFTQEWLESGLRQGVGIGLRIVGPLVQRGLAPHGGDWGIVCAIILDDLKIGSTCSQPLRHGLRRATSPCTGEAKMRWSPLRQGRYACCSPYFTKTA